MDDKQQKAYEQFQNVNYESFSDWLSLQSGFEVAFICNLIGLFISRNLNYDQLHALGNFFVLLGHTVVTIGVQQKLAVSTKAKYAPLDQSDIEFLYGELNNCPLPNGEIEMLKEQIKNLHKEINNFKPK